MPRYTRQAFWCGTCHSRNEGNSRHCLNCGTDSIERHAQPNASDRAVFFRHPLTGEIRRPARADQPMPAEYARQGYQREEVMSMIRHERETGSVHEDSNFRAGNEPVPEREITPSVPKHVKEALIRDVMDAHQSGNWTMDTPLADAAVGS